MSYTNMCWTVEMWPYLSRCVIGSKLEAITPCKGSNLPARCRFDNFMRPWAFASGNSRTGVRDWIKSRRPFFSYDSTQIFPMLDLLSHTVGKSFWSDPMRILRWMFTISRPESYILQVHSITSTCNVVFATRYESSEVMNSFLWPKPCVARRRTFP